MSTKWDGDPLIEFTYREVLEWVKAHAKDLDIFLLIHSPGGRFFIVKGFYLDHRDCWLSNVNELHGLRNRRDEAVGGYYLSSTQYRIFATYWGAYKAMCLENAKLAEPT